MVLAGLFTGPTIRHPLFAIRYSLFAIHPPPPAKTAVFWYNIPGMTSFPEKLKMSMILSWRFWLGFLMSLAFLYAVFYQTDPREVWLALQTANYFWLFPAIAVYFLGVWLRAWRWHYLLRSIQALPVNLLFKTIIVGYTANDLLPFRLGELVRAYFLGARAGVSKAATLTTIVVERVLDGLTMLLFMVVASFFLPLDQALQGIVRLSAVLLLAMLLLMLLAVATWGLSYRLLVRAAGLLPASIGDRMVGLGESFLKGLGAMKQGKDFLAVLAFSILGWLPEVGMYALIGQGFGLNKPFSAFMLATAAGNLGAMVPSTPGYVGVFDAPAKYALVLAGVGNDIAASYVLVVHAALIMPVVLLGLYYVWQEGASLRPGRLEAAGKKS